MKYGFFDRLENLFSEVPELPPEERKFRASDILEIIRFFIYVNLGIFLTGIILCILSP